MTVGGLSGRDVYRYRREIFATRPAVLVIQADLILRRISRQPTEALNRGKVNLQRWTHFLGDPLLKFLPASQSTSAGAAKLFGELSMNAQVDTRFSKQNVTARNFNAYEDSHWTNLVVSTDTKEYQVGRAFIEEAYANVIPIIILEPPICKTAAGLATREYLEKRRAVISGLLKPSSDLYLYYAPIMPDENFKDLSHME